MSGYVFPTDEYNENNLSLVTVPKAAIPFFRRLWEILQDRSTWYDRESWFRGYQVAAWLEEMLMTNAFTDLVEGQNRIYRLLDTALNGTEYTATPDGFGGYTFEPEIATVPPVSASAPNALRAHVGRLWRLVENSTSGATYGAGAGIDGAPALGDDQSDRAALRELLDQVETLLGDIKDALQ
jgi:hypothetical protein